MDVDVHHSGAPTETAVARTDSSSSACTIPKRTRSQLTAPNDIFRMPLARSPLKDARAHARAQAQATLSKQRSQPHTQRPRQGAESGSAPSGKVESEGGRGSMQNTEQTEAIGVVPSQEMEKPHDDDDDIRGSGDDDPHKHAGPTGAKKRASPDTEPVRLTSPSAGRNPKRAKFEAMKVLSKKEEVAHPGMEYDVPLRDDDCTSPRSRTRRFVRASSVVSPNRPASIFPPRAKSVPLEAEDIAPPLDLTAVPPSPRRSPKKGIEIRRAPSQPPPDEDSMDVDRAEPSSSDLSYFTNVASFPSPRKYPAFNYAVNFATPLTARRHTGHHSIPISPLTPLPPTPFTARLPNTESSLAQRAQSILRRPKDIDMLIDVPTSPVDDSPPLDSPPRPQHEPTQLDISRPSSAASTLSDLSSIDESSDPPSRSQELMPPPPVPLNRAPPAKTNEITPHLTTVESDAALTQYFTNPTAGSSKKRPMVVGGMKLKPGSTVSSALRRVTRSAMKETEGDFHRDHEGANGSNSGVIPASTLSTSSMSVAAPSTFTKVQPAKRTSRSKPPALQKRSASSSALVSTSNNSKQTSLFAFIGVKPAVTTSTTSSSKSIPPPSPSKIPLPLSPVKRTPGKPRSFTISSTGVTTSTDIFGGTSRGRALSTLSHALEKLSVPPPSRPNTSLGFLSLDDPADDGAPTGDDKGSAKDDASALSAPSRSAGTNRGRESGFARPTASSLRRAATVSGPVTKQGIGGSSVVARMQRYQGVAGRERVSNGIFSRVGERASKNPTLPTVVGSPVKGSCLVELEVTTANEREDDHGVLERASLHGTSDITDGTSDATRRDTEAESPGTSPSSPMDKGKQRAAISSSLALNPASAALHALSESLSSLPQTPPATKPRPVGTRLGLRSTSMATNKGSPAENDPGSALSNASGADLSRSVDAGPSSGSAEGTVVNGSGGGKKSSLKVLKKCAIFVDVRTDQGDDAGSLFVDMLRGLGAKIMGRVCQSCTHIVFKNGLPNTLARYRLLDSKPHVVGIAWVVECVEQRARMDEEKYKVDVEFINVAGGNKRRRSMLPRHLIPQSPAPDTFSVAMNTSSDGGEEDTSTKAPEESPSQDADISVRSRDEDDLPPLERARRRRSILPGGQTKLFG